MVWFEKRCNVKIRTNDGRVFEGTHVQVMQGMRAVHFSAGAVSLIEFVRKMARDAQAQGYDVAALEPDDPGGKDDETVCRMFLEVMLDRGLIQLA